MALYKVLCAVAVTILLTLDGCLSYMRECGRGGTGMEADQMPWQAHITWKNGEKHCSGFLINDQWVMTSSNSDFESGMDTESMMAFLGQRNDSSSDDFEESMEVDSMKCHNKAVCLLKLKKQMAYRESISPVCLPRAGSLYHKKKNFMAWGEASSAMEEVPMVDCRCYRSDLKEGKICAGKEAKKGTMEDCWKNLGSGLMTHENSWWTMLGMNEFDQDQECPPTGCLRAYNDLSLCQHWIKAVTGMDEEEFVPLEADPEEENWDFACPEHTMLPADEWGKPYPPPCDSGKEDCIEDRDSYFSNGVNVMHSSPFVLLCVLALSLYGTSW